MEEKRTYHRIEPLIIAVEGVDGSGKTSLIRGLIKYYRRQRDIKTYVVPRKYYQLRRYIAHLMDVGAPMEPTTYLHLMAAGAMKARRVKSGLTFYDRYIDTFRVRALLFGVPAPEVKKAFQRHYQAELTLVLKLPAKEALARKEGKSTRIEQGSPELFKGSPFTSFEEYQTAFQQKLLQFAEKSPERYLVIDATATPEEILKKAQERIDTMIKAKPLLLVPLLPP
ncbi:MAG: dTMP kinase [Bacteroidota bacterium]